MSEMTNAHKILGGIPQGKKPVWRSKRG